VQLTHPRSVAVLTLALAWCRRCSWFMSLKQVFNSTATIEQLAFCELEMRYLWTACGAQHYVSEDREVFFFLMDGKRTYYSYLLFDPGKEHGKANFWPEVLRH